MTTYQIDLTDTFGKVERHGALYTGPTARKDAQAMARYIRDEISRFGYQDGRGRRISGVRVVPRAAERLVVR